MANRFKAERLSAEGRALIRKMYVEEDKPFSQIQAALRRRTGEQIGLSSLHRYCVRRLRRDGRTEQLKRHHEDLLAILKDTGLAEREIDLVASLSAVLDLQHAMLTQKFDEMVSVVKDLLSTPLSTRLKQPDKRPKNLL